MKKILILLIMATAMVLGLAPAAGAQVWPSEQPSQDAPVPEPEPPTPEAKQDDQRTVEIQDFEFSQAQLTVEAGATVTWENQGNAPHTVTADNGSFDSGRLQPGQSFSHTFQSPGTVPYHCEIHREMTASVTASGRGATTADSKGITQPPKVEQETPTKQTSSSGGWLTTALIIGVILVVAAALGWVLLRRRAS